MHGTTVKKRLHYLYWQSSTKTNVFIAVQNIYWMSCRLRDFRYDLAEGMRYAVK